MKKVLLIVIDALSSRHVEEAFRQGRLPNMQRLAELGHFHNQCVAVFPSITPAATASIITGRYPADHGISGAFFYDNEKGRVCYLGDDIWPILRKGFADFFNDLLVRFNQELLSADTLFDHVERSGKRAAALNFLVSQGQHEHQVDVPWLLRLFPNVPWQETIRGPDLLCLGDFVTGKPREGQTDLSGPGGAFNRFGFHDDNTAQLLLELAAKNAWRDLNVAYFPDNDFDSHTYGPTSAVASLEKLDQHLGKLFEVCGGVEELLTHTAVLVTGRTIRKAISSLTNGRGPIALQELLDSYPLVPAGGDWTSDDQLMICPNMRACKIYSRSGCWPDLKQIIDRIASDPRVDQVIWRTESDDGVPHFHVYQQEDAQLEFWQTGDSDSQGRDAFGNHWKWQGSLVPVSGRVSQSGRLDFSDYPNALERIAQAFPKPTGGELWITAEVGYEFKLPDTNVHHCGSHGSLHYLDSTSPLIVAGAPDGFSLPDQLRSVDVAGMCLRILDIDADVPAS